MEDNLGFIASSSQSGLYEGGGEKKREGERKSLDASVQGLDTDAHKARPVPRSDLVNAPSCSHQVLVGFLTLGTKTTGEELEREEH